MVENIGTGISLSETSSKFKGFFCLSAKFLGIPLLDKYNQDVLVEIEINRLLHNIDMDLGQVQIS